MKPRCPTNCGRDIGANRVLCETCWALVPRPLVNNIVSAWAVVRQTRNAYVMQAALRKHRLAKQAAVQHVIDRQNEKVSA